MRKLFTAIAASSIATCASAQIIDFQSLEHVDGNTDNHGFSYSENGYTISQDPNNPFEFATFGTLESRYPGSTALFNNTGSAEIVLEKNDGGLFTIMSIDISRLNTTSPVSVTFSGERNGTVLDTVTFTTTIADNVLETFNFPPDFTAVDRVTWTQDSPFHQFDNINVAPLGVQVIDFQGLAHNDSVDQNHGFSYTEDGFDLNTDPNNPFEFASRGTQQDRYAGSTGLYNNTVGGVTELTDNQGRPFGIQSIDLADLNNNGPVTTTFVGELGGVVVANQSFTTTGSDNNFEQFNFNSNFNRVDRVSWSQDSPFHQFDNIRVNPVGPRIIDFERLEHEDNFVARHGYGYSEHGYLIQGSFDNGGTQQLSTFGTTEGRYPGSTAMFHNDVDETISLTRNDGARFDPISIDIANLNGTGPVTVTFDGFRSGVRVANQSYTTTNANNELETVIFNRDFTGVDRVTWTQNSPFHQFDNINVQPERSIDFQALAHNDGTSQAHGFSYNEDGMTLRTDPNNPFQLNTRGTKESTYAGSTGMYNNTVGGVTELVHGGGDRFSVRSIDIADLNNTGPVTTSFVGRLNGNVVANQSFTTTGSDNPFATFFFNDDFLNVDNVSWSQDSPFHQFDNIRFGDAVGGCPADLDGDGDADADDFFAYLDAFAGGNLAVCDIDGDGDCDADDFFGYLDLFAQGC